MTSRTVATPPRVGVGDVPRNVVLREITERAVLQALLDTGGPLTRTEIARRCEVSRPTAAEAVRRLEADDLVTAVGPRSGHAGPVATLYDLSDAVGAAMGVSLDATESRVAFGCLGARTLDESVHPAPTDPDAAADRLRSLVADAVAALRARGQRLRAVAVSLANPVDPADGVAIRLPETSFPQGLLAPARVLEEWEVPVLTDNDVNYAAQAESRDGVARGVSNFVYLHVGRGRAVGAGVVVDGAVVRGAQGLAGEIGYLPVEGLRHGLSRAMEETRLDEGGGIDRAGLHLGKAAAGVCAVTDPELVVLGGPLGGHPGLLEAVARTVADLGPRPVPVVAGHVGASAPALGALGVARDRAWADILDGRRAR